MINVTRPPRPKVLGERAKQAKIEAREFFEGRRAVSKQQVRFADFEFDAGLWHEVEPVLLVAFHNKCAFCESDLSRDGGLLAHFRPTRDALNLDGAMATKHYYWLAYEWKNLYWMCAACSKNKRNLFPVTGERAAPGASIEAVEREESRLLLDPCRDLPEEHLLFHDDGRVASVTLERSAPDRGTATIDTFGLNRDQLVAMRAEAVKQTEVELEAALADTRRGTVEYKRAINRLGDPARPYAMVRRQVVARALAEIGEDEDLQVARLATEAARAVQTSKPRQKRAFEQLERHEAKQEGAGIRDPASYARTTRITRVRLENFRSVEELEFEIPTTGWKMLIGENGSGKSSILQAVAIALMGAVQANRLRQSGDLVPEKLVRRGATSARILVHQAAALEPIEVRITRNGFQYPPGVHRQKAILLGFGAARWLPRRKSLRPEADEWIRVRNLLNPFVPLGDANTWLCGLRSGTNRFRTAESVIKALLRLRESTRLRVVGGEVRVQDEGQPRSRALTLDQLSDGYQSALAMATGMMGPLFSKWDVVREAEGIVLIDELDAHLHPRWKMRIVSDLRRAFPNVQFITSTHEPLCLRGLVDREILLLRRVDGLLTYTDDLPSPKSMRVDQLLTSRFFGLYSTFDPETERDFERYYDLLALDDRTTEQEAELNALRQSVGQDGVLGDSPRDQAIYAVVDRYIAKQLRGPTPTTLGAETEQQVTAIWRDTIASDPEVEKALAEILDA